MKEQAEKYAKSITKNETYKKYLIDAFIEGWKQKEKEISIDNKPIYTPF